MESWGKNPKEIVAWKWGGGGRGMGNGGQKAQPSS